MVGYRRWAHVSGLERPDLWVRRACANLAVSQFRRRLVELRALARLGSRREGPASSEDERGVLGDRTPPSAATGPGRRPPVRLRHADRRHRRCPGLHAGHRQAAPQPGPSRAGSPAGPRPGGEVMSLDARIASAIEDLERQDARRRRGWTRAARETDRRRRTGRQSARRVVGLLAAGLVWRLGGPTQQAEPGTGRAHMSNGVLARWRSTATGHRSRPLDHSCAARQALRLTAHLSVVRRRIQLVHDTTGGDPVRPRRRDREVRTLATCPTPYLAGASPDMVRTALASEGGPGCEHPTASRRPATRSPPGAPVGRPMAPGSPR